MIVFDLDGTIANCEHRRHFVDPNMHPEYSFKEANLMTVLRTGYFKPRLGTSGFIRFKPDWKAFYEACDKDEIILPVAFQFYALREKFGICHPIQIWSGRCESVKGKTIDWLQMHFTKDIDWNSNLKMRPIGDNTPDDQLKEKWLDEAIAEGKTIDMVFDDRPKVVRMWQRRGVFVFDVGQGKGEF